MVNNNGEERVELVREEDGLTKTVSVHTWHDGTLHHVVITYRVSNNPVPDTRIEPGVTSLEAAKRDARLVVERLRGEGVWKDALSAEEKKRIEKRNQESELAIANKDRQREERLKAFPRTKLDRQLAAAIAKPAGVVELDLHGRDDNDDERLSVVPPTIGKLKDLEVLVLDANKLEELPSEMELLKKLRILHLAKNRLVDARPVSYLKNLVLLNLYGNRLTEVFAGHHQKDFELQIGANPLARGGRIGFFKKTRVFGIDTDALFPIGDRAEGGKCVEVLQLYGRAPTSEEREEAEMRFPKAQIEHLPNANKPNIVMGSGDDGRRAETTKKAGTKKKTKK